MNKTTLEERFEEKFIEFAPDGSNWGAGLRIRHTGTTQDREILDDIKDFIKQELQQERERCLKLVEEKQFEINIDEYLPKVREWEKGYDKPFDDGYEQFRKDIIKAINQHNE